MGTMNRLLLAAAFVMTPVLAAAHTELVREPRGIDTIDPAASPAAGRAVARRR